jgi:acyl carrier protein
VNSDEAARLVHSAFHAVAPETDLSTIDPDGLLQEEMDIDSMDFISVVTTIQSAGVAIPERDYPMLSTLRGFIAYLTAAARTP